MDRGRISRLAHAAHPIAAPVSLENLRALVGRLRVPEGGAVLDLGCGRGWWLRELLAAHPSATGVGVDVELPAEARADAAAAGLGERVQWQQADAASWAGGSFDVVLCVGASHAFGGLDGTLAAVRRHLRPGGQVLIGDGIWEGPPTPEAQRALEAGPDDLPDLAGLLDRFGQHGFEPGYGHVSTLGEWDEYEFSWTGSLVAWALSAAGSADEREAALAAAREHREAWARGWRRQLGFATVLLHDLASDEAH